MIKRTVSLILTAALVAIVSRLGAQDSGPKRDVGESVAKPKKGAVNSDSDLPKIPSKLTNKDKSVLPPDAPSFQVNASLVSVDVAVLDSKGHFIPNIPKSNFRILEDHVPQSIRTFSIGEAPVTVCMVIEFSNRFQQYRSSTRDQTL